MRTLRIMPLLVAAHLLQAQNGATVEGLVQDSITGAGIAGVTVRLYTQQGTHYETITDSSGAYRITGMSGGDYESRFEKSGFAELETDVLKPIAPQRLHVDAAKDALRLNHQLAPLAILRGRVTGVDGKPVAKAEVTISLGPEGIAATDAEGNYVFDKLRPGTYAIRAAPPANTKPVVRDGIRTEIVPVFFPSSIDRADAQMVAVRGGSDQSGFDIRLQEMPVYRIKGAVLDEAGKPVSGAYVRLTGVTSGSFLTGQMMLGYPQGARYLLVGRLPAVDEANFTTKDDGRFEFSSVRSGDWRVFAESAPARDPATRRDVMSTGEAPALVARHDLDDLEITLAPPFTRDGIVDWGDVQVAPADRRSYLRLIDPDSGRISMGFGSQTGALQFQNLNAGRYRIEPMPALTSGYYSGPVFLGDQEVTGQVVTLNATSLPVRVLMKANPGTIRGTVENGSGSAILLAPATAANPDALLAIVCGADGAFQIPGLPPGAYSIVAYDRLGTEQGSNIPVSTIMAAATRIRVDEGATATLQLNLNRWPN